MTKYNVKIHFTTVYHVSTWELVTELFRRVPRWLNGRYIAIETEIRGWR